MRNGRSGSKGRILVASPSSFRQSWFAEQLVADDWDVDATDSALTCLDVARNHEVAAALIEPGLRWGGADGFLALRECDPQLRAIPVILIMIWAPPNQAFQLAPYSVQDLLHRWPSASAFAQCVRRVALLRAPDSVRERECANGPSSTPHRS